MELIAVGIVTGALFLFLVGRRNESRAREQWLMVLTAEGERRYNDLAERVRHERWMAEESYGAAAKARDEGSLEEAVRLLRVGASVVESCSDTVPALLRGLGLLARQAAAIAPVLAPQPYGFLLRGLRERAGFVVVLHHLLSTTRERLALRVRWLRYAVPACTRWLLRFSRRAQARPENAGEWARIMVGRHDLGVLTEDSLDSLLVVLRSLAAVPARAGQAAAARR